MAIVSTEFQHQSVRDLAWAVASPPLILQPNQSCHWPDQHWYRRRFEESLAWIKTIDTDPSELEELLAKQKDRRLGKYFETLWFYWFSHNPRYEMVANNLQIIIDGQTLGEIDFIVLDKITGKTIHWEVAVKFYLGLGETTKMCNWHGPNLRDRLDIKVDHLLQRQSLLSTDVRVKAWLKEKEIDVDQCAVILKGRLYFPWQNGVGGVGEGESSPQVRDMRGMLRSPPQCCPDYLFSWWFRRRQFDDYFKEEQRFTPLLNSGWMENFPTKFKTDSYLKSEIFKTVSDKKLHLPMHLKICKPCHSWDRVFIVEENWASNIS